MSAETTEIPKSVPVLEQNDSRNNLVATAVKFLQNPKVYSSPLEQKKNFLKKKGLTDAEINKAVELAGISISTLPPAAENQLSTSPHQPVLVQPLPVSGWARIREYSSLAIVVAGIAYGLYSLYKKFIEPFILKRQTEEDKKWEKMQKDVSNLNTEVTTSLQKMQEMMCKLQQQIMEQNTEILSVSSNLEIYRDAVKEDTSEKAISTLRGDITSLKGLLLNAKQFPASPAIQPAIPSWQMHAVSTSPTSLVSSSMPPASTPSGKFSVSEPHMLQHGVNPERSVDQNPGAHSKKNPADLEQEEDEYCVHGPPSNGESVPGSTDKLLNGDVGNISPLGSDTASTPEVVDRPETVIGSPVKPLSAVEDSEID